ncbi:hypothetical protein EJB05_07361 [Eragrostis curvula]|uniref:glucan endo-1,3-beta-D-glucosidase n=1 Tax=Eragrostis curvula TaxID=38414 RepID=A0A5J9WGA1_9POAL|nr:hypothetical protein EJB05_07361 [Eragrostis curvula]
MAPCCSPLQVAWDLRRPRGFPLAAALCAAAVVALSLALASDATSASLVGINYGRVGSNLPPPQDVPPLVRSLGIGRVRVYDADPAVLRAFSKTGVELVVGVPDQCLASVADPGGAAQWLKENVLPFLPDTKVAALAVGNEVLTGNDTALSRALLPAMESLHGAVAALGLDKQIAVTTAHSLRVLGTSFPPSAGAFRKDLLPYLCPVLDYHARTGSPFLVNAYPYFAYSDDPKGVHLDYALLEPGYPGVPDPNSGLHYPNLLVAQVDAVYHAIAAANAAASRVVEVRVSETGWPSAGSPNETAATPQNAARYNSNAMRLVAEGKGTPLKPGVPLRAYVFALFNENLKPGLASERNYGLYKPDGTHAYELSFTPASDNSTVVCGGGGNNLTICGGGVIPYYNISAASSNLPKFAREPFLTRLAGGCGRKRQRQSWWWQCEIIKTCGGGPAGLMADC